MKEVKMAPRPYWKGVLRLSLVTCPIALYPATTQREKTHFHQINTKTGRRLRVQMVDEQTGRAVDSEHRGRGYEISKGRFVEIEPNELDAVKLESTHTIEIDSFVAIDELDERYLDKPYYIVPNGKVGADAFAVMRDAMAKAGKMALGRVVLTNREHVIAIRPLGQGLIGTTLHYPYEIRDESDFFDEIPRPRISKDMIELASHILETKTAKFDPHAFKDRYENALRAVVRRKAAGKAIEPAVQPENASVVDLMAALRQSLGRRPASTAKSAGRLRRGRVSKERRRRRAA